MDASCVSSMPSLRPPVLCLTMCRSIASGQNLRLTEGTPSLPQAVSRVSDALQVAKWMVSAAAAPLRAGLSTTAQVASLLLPDSLTLTPTPGHVMLQNVHNPGAWLAIRGGMLTHGSGGPHCEFFVHHHGGWSAWRASCHA
jgi:hypothetical protein